jgi:predicted exporter
VIVLSFSGAVLAVSFLLIYVPGLRHPAVFAAGAVALAALGAIYPDPAILGAQAAAVGIALVPLARVLEWTVTNRRVQRLAVRPAAYAKPDSKVADIPVRSEEASSQTGTAPHFRMTAAEPQL